ncbi:MAG: hypothetical protein P8Z40_01120 [Chloroflexota bacterium]
MDEAIMAGSRYWDVERKRAWLLLITLLLCYAYFFPRWADWNQNSRFDLVLAIVDQGTLCIDDYYQNTGDYALFEGHHYSDKAPGTSFLGVPFYYVFKQLVGLRLIEGQMSRLEANPALADTLLEGGTGLQVSKVYFAVALTFVTFCVVAIPSACLGVLLYLWTGYITRNPLYRLGVPLTYGLLTNAFPYSNMFFGHQIVATLLFAAFYVLFRIERREISPAWSLLAGLMLGYAVITEYPTALISAGLCVYAFFAIPNRRWLAGLVLAGLPPGLLLMIYNYAIFRTPLPVGYRYSELYTEQHSSGFLSLSYPRLNALWGITFGSYRGLFFISPVLLLAVAGLVVWGRRRVNRRAWWVCSYAVIIFFLFNGSSIMWQGGYSIGPRYLLPMLPFLVVGLTYFFDAWGHRSWARGLTLVVGAWSVFAVWAETLGGQSFPDWTLNPLFNYSLPNLAVSNIARNVGIFLGLSGWASLLPLLIGLGVGLLLLMRASPEIPAETER